MVAYDDPPAAKAAIEWFNGMRLFRDVMVCDERQNRLSYQ